MWTSLGLNAINPWLLFGGLAVASPIIIHLLSKRKFKVVNWAAMEFLLQASRRNQRRVKLEQLLLLLLRCLAILLIALLVSRPFLQPSGWLADVVATGRTERIVLLDDSPSMQAIKGTKTAFDVAKGSMEKFLRSRVEAGSGDSITLLTTSQPGRPVINGQFITEAKIDSLVQQLVLLEPADLSAQLDKGLVAVEKLLDSRDGNINRVVYLVTDLRQGDWGTGTNNSKMFAMLKRIRDRVQGFQIVDVGGENKGNVSITDIKPLQKSLVAGVPARFEVELFNSGEEEAHDIEVSFTAGNAPQRKTRAESIKPNQKAVVPFSLAFSEPGSLPVKAEIPADSLPADNTRYFAARVRDGIQVLVVDGEPSSERGESESFFLERALTPPGDQKSGNLLKVVTENQFEDADLALYQVVILCNVYRISEERIQSLTKWVNEGGGLTFFLGDQVDDLGYSDRLHQEGQGLFPMRLVAAHGDETQRKWVSLALKMPNHPFLKIFEGEQNPLLQSVKVFQWWHSAIPEDELSAGRSRVLANFTDTEDAPAIVERFVGKGRVMAVATSADPEWNTWATEPSYVISLLELSGYLARSDVSQGDLPIGLPLQHRLDASNYELEAKIETPVENESITIKAEPDANGKELQFNFDRVNHSGFYAMYLKPRDGDEERILFSTNIDSAESDLRRVDSNTFKAKAQKIDVNVIQGLDLRGKSDTSGKTELWRHLLIALALVLLAEQAFAWWLGRRLGG